MRGNEGIDVDEPQAHPGDFVKLRQDPTQDDRDAYGRMLRYVNEGALDYGRTQIERGWAKVYVFEARFKRQREYRSAQHNAKRAGRGVWSRCDGSFHTP